MFKEIATALAVTAAAPVLALDAPAAGAGQDNAFGDGTDASPSTSDGMVAPVKTVEGMPQAPARQVAAIVSREFAAYDTDRSGKLAKTEFAAWMAALKAQAPAAEPGDTVSKPWTEAAFKQANTSGSGAVSREELTAFFNGAKPARSGA